MNHADVIKRVSSLTGTTLKSISDAFGQHPGTLRNALSLHTNMRIRKYADILELCGYRLVAMPRSEELPLESYAIDGTNEDDGKVTIRTREVR